MISSKYVLLLHDGPEPLIEVECLLRVMGYQFIVLNDVEQAVSLCRKSKGTQKTVDLLIADIEPCSRHRLIASQRSGLINRLLLIHREFDCEELFCIEERVGHHCHYPATLACVQELINSTSCAKKNGRQLMR